MFEQIIDELERSSAGTGTYVDGQRDNTNAEDVSPRDRILKRGGGGGGGDGGAVAVAPTPAAARLTGPPAQHELELVGGGLPFGGLLEQMLASQLGGGGGGDGGGAGKSVLCVVRRECCRIVPYTRTPCRSLA
jgi:hypothetical protein